MRCAVPILHSGEFVVMYVEQPQEAAALCMAARKAAGPTALVLQQPIKDGAP